MFYFKKKAAEAETEKLTTVEMTCAIQDSTEQMITSMIGDVLAINGCEISEIPLEYVQLYNKYVGQWKEMMGICIKYARYQDEVNKETSEKLDKIIGLLESKAWKQCISGQIEKNRQALAEISDRLDAVDKKNKKE